jgi:hypothetical protein
MSKLDTDDRQNLKDSHYAYISDEGDRKLPMPDEEHVRKAIQRFGQTDFNGNASAKRDAAEKGAGPRQGLWHRRRPRRRRLSVRPLARGGPRHPVPMYPKLIAST